MTEKQNMMLLILDGSATSEIKKRLSTSVPYEYTDGEISVRVKYDKAALAHEGCFIQTEPSQLAQVYFELITDGDPSEFNYEEITYDEYCS